MAGPAGGQAQMNLAVFLTADGNYHHLGWRHPDSWVDGGTNFDRWIAFAQICEAAKLDMLFIADQIAVVGGEDMAAITNSSKLARLEPMTLPFFASIVKYTFPFLAFFRWKADSLAAFFFTEAMPFLHAAFVV